MVASVNYTYLVMIAVNTVNGKNVGIYLKISDKPRLKM